MQLNACQTFAYPRIQITRRLHQGCIKVSLKFLLSFHEAAPKLPEFFLRLCPVDFCQKLLLIVCYFLKNQMWVLQTVKIMCENTLRPFLSDTDSMHEVPPKLPLMCLKDVHRLPSGCPKFVFRLPSSCPKIA